MFAHIGGEIKQKIRQSVNFYGVRHREVKYSETYKKVIRVPTNIQLTSASKVTNIRDLIQTKEINVNRDLTAYNIMRENHFRRSVYVFYILDSIIWLTRLQT